MAFGRAWQHAKYSYGVWQSFAHNSENFQKTAKIEKCEHFFEMLGFGTRRVEEVFLLLARTPATTLTGLDLYGFEWIYIDLYRCVLMCT
jgi:hypothetical protein